MKYKEKLRRHSDYSREHAGKCRKHAASKITTMFPTLVAMYAGMFVIPINPSYTL